MLANRPKLMRMSLTSFILSSVLVFSAWTLTVSAQEVLSASNREVPGAQATYELTYSAPGARHVEISGIWDKWSKKNALTRVGDLWKFDLRKLRLKEGRFEFKFITDGEWETGANRILFTSPDGMAERPPDLVKGAQLRQPNLIQVEFTEPVSAGSKIKVELIPPVSIGRQGLTDAHANDYPAGYFIKNGQLTFVLNPELYGITLTPRSRVTVAGSFNKWEGTGRNPRWRLHLKPGGSLWFVTMPAIALQGRTAQEAMLFKFVVDESQWLSPPVAAPNRTVDPYGNANLEIPSLKEGRRYYSLELLEPLDLSQPLQVKVSGLWKRALYAPIDSKPVLDSIMSDKPMGVTRKAAPRLATYRIFAPRASSMDLLLYDQPYSESKGKAIPPDEEFAMWQDPVDGVWEVTLMGWDLGRHYAYRINGPETAGEGFRKDAIVGDPYAAAAPHAENLPILVDTQATNRWFSGWTDEGWRAPQHEDLIIYETHVRDLTMHPSSPVRPPFKGNYEGIVKSLGTGTGLDHLKDLGVNAIEFLPIHEFNNGPDGHNWGYATVYFFAPEASYAMDPLRGSQVYEFKRLVNELHAQGFAVVLDVVYNHVGHPNLFSDIDRKYYFRLNPDFSFQNYSGVGNDVRSEAPMMRRLIVDSILYWMQEYHIDGFRFDLAELIDLDTLKQIREEAVKINPNILLVSEPWSFRGTHKERLKGTGWAAWNDDFRYRIKEFAHGNADRESVKKVIEGSTKLWTDSPLQSVNYVESHDDHALVDEMSMRPDKNAMHLTEQDAQAVRLAGTVVYTSLGIPLIHEGQEYLRSKRGISNTYNKGDAINALNWTERDRPLAKEALNYYRGLIALRTSEAGASFRVRKTPQNYIRWISPQDHKAVGFVINEHGNHPGKAFVVLLNSSSRSASFEFDLPVGEWVKIADGTHLNPKGLDGQPTVSNPTSRRMALDVEGISSTIYMRK